MNRPYRAVWRDAEGEHEMTLVPGARGIVQHIADLAADALFGAGRDGAMIVCPV